MIDKKPFNLTITLLTLSANLCALTLWQLPSHAHTIQTRQNKRSLAFIKKPKSPTSPSQIVASNLDSAKVNKLESNNLNSGFIPQSDIDFAPNPATQVARSTFSGRASWYGPGFHGRRTANGEVFNSNALTAAHRSLPFGTRVRVTNIHNGRSVIVRINDRGPFIRGRIIDVSAGAARILRMIHSGVAPVRIEILGR